MICAAASGSSSDFAAAEASRPKLVCIGDDGQAEVGGAADSEKLADIIENVTSRLASAAFTGKGDAERVRDMFTTYLYTLQRGAESVVEQSLPTSTSRDTVVL